LRRALWPAGYPFWSDLWIRSSWRVQRRGGEYRLVDPTNRIVHAGARGDCIQVGRGLAPPAGRSRGVILLHGLAHWRRTLWRLGDRLESCGWAVADAGYASVTEPFEQHVRSVRAIAEGLVEDGAVSVSVVGHSLGGLIGRVAMAGDWPAGKLVQLGSPNQGSVVAERLAPFGLYRRIFGPCGQLLVPMRVASLPVPDCPILIVAGGTGGIGFNPLLTGDNDGTVRVAETRLDAAQVTYQTVFSPHALLPHHRAAQTAAVDFLGP
jgi:hypothetical protein